MTNLYWAIKTEQQYKEAEQRLEYLLGFDWHTKEECHEIGRLHKAMYYYDKRNRFTTWERTMEWIGDAA